MSFSACGSDCFSGRVSVSGWETVSVSAAWNGRHRERGFRLNGNRNVSNSMGVFPSILCDCF